MIMGSTCPAQKNTQALKDALYEMEVFFGVFHFNLEALGPYDLHQRIHIMVGQTKS